MATHTLTFLIWQLWQIELSLKASLLEMERIFIVLKAELLSGSTLTDELLPLVDNYSWLEQALLLISSL